MNTESWQKIYFILSAIPFILGFIRFSPPLSIEIIVAETNRSLRTANLQAAYL